MKLLKEKIQVMGRAVDSDILKVDSFLNHQIDPELMMALGEEFARRFAQEGITKIITLESSGIAPAVMAGLKLGVPVVFAKKQKPSTMGSGFFTSSVHSFTKQKNYSICLSSSFLKNTDRVLIIDDFLAYGSAAEALIDIVTQADAHLAGIGIVIEKGFQKGGALLRAKDIRVESLAIIEEMSENRILFRD